MKIVHITNLAMGGIGRLVTDMANRQAESNSVVIVSPLDIPNYFCDQFVPGVEYIKFGIRSGFSLNLVEYRKIARYLSQFDVLHFHGFNPLLMLFCLPSRKKIVYTEHGTFVHANQFNSFKNFVKKVILGRIFLRFVPGAIVFNSNWMKENSRLRNRVSRVIYNGVRHKDCKLPPPRTEPCNLLSVGRVVRKKRIDKLIAVLSRLGDTPFYFKIIGSGPDADRLQQIASRSLPPRSFDFLGQKFNVDNHYQESEMFLLGSEGEPFGLVVLEAIANGSLPLMFRDAGGALEIVANQNPRLVSEDEGEMAENIRYWHLHPEERMAAVESLQEKMLSHFTVDIMASRYFRLYETLQAHA